MKIILIALFLFTGCEKLIDEVQDTLVTNVNSVKHARLECYSAGGKFFDYEHDGPIWENENGGYRITKMHELITVNGDCVLTEKFEE
jgi:hypothetical protein